MSLSSTFGRICRETRLGLDVSQRELAEAIGVSRGYVAHIERGTANPPIGLVERVGTALGIQFELVGRPPILEPRPRQHDLVHAWCSGYVDRRLRRAGWLTEREAEIVHGQHHGWIDCVAFRPSTATMLVIEIKTRLHDLGATERQLGWYERSAPGVARRLGWQAKRIHAWLLALESDEVDESIRVNRAVLASAFPDRATGMATTVDGAAGAGAGRGLALIDPSSKRRTWLIPARIDGRRSPGAFANYQEAARRLTR